MSDLQIELLDHAKLSASGSPVWLVCHPSARLQEQFAEEDSTYSSEGTFGHSVFNHRLCVYLGRSTEYLGEDFIPGYVPYFNKELDDAVSEAQARAIERIEYARSVCKDPVILLEQRLDFSPWVQDGFGTGDLVIITDSYIEVLDLKMGSGVRVSAYENSQFRLYALGAYNTFGHLYDVPLMRGGVLQPRLNNYSTEEISLQELLKWADEVVRPAAVEAWNGTGQFVPGDHCSSGFCKARFNCAARAKANLAVAKTDFALTEPELLTDEQVIAVLEKADAAIKWLNDVQSFALKEAKTGKAYPGFKLVEGRSVRKYSSEDAVAAALQTAGFPEAVIYERSLLGITAMKKAIGKKRFTELLEGLVTKPAGSPVLVPVTDKREAINSTATAVGDFS